MLLLLSGVVLVLVFACLLCAVSCRVLRVLWLACWCRSGVTGGQGGLARALVSGRLVRRGGLGSAQHFRVRRYEPAGSWVRRREVLAPCVSLIGIRRKGMVVSVEVRLSSLDAVSFLGCGECAPRTIFAGYMYRNRPSDQGV